MSQLLKVPTSTLEKYHNHAKGILQSKNAFRSLNIRTKAEYIDKFGKNQQLSRPSKGTVESLEAIEKTLGVYFTICDVLISNGHFDRTNINDVEFLNMFALYGGVQAGLEELCIEDEEVNSGVAQVRLNFKDNNFSDQFLDTFIDGVRSDKKVNSGEKLKQVTKGYLEKTLETIHEAKDKYPGLVDLVSKIDLQVNGITLQGFGLMQEQKQDDSFTVDFSDLVGVNDVSRNLIKHIGNLFAYQMTADPSFGQKVPNVILLYGPPGTGKSSLINAVGKYMRHFSEVAGIGFKYKTVSGDLKSKYMGESTRNLREAVGEVQRFKGAGLIWTDEADMLFTNDLDNDSPAEKRFLSEAMQMIEGVQRIIPNYIWIMTTNNPENFYTALKRRIKAQYLVEGPVTAEDHSKLFSMLTGKWKKKGLIVYKDHELEKIGEYCEQLGFRGRETTNLTDLLVGKTDSVTITPQILKEQGKEIGKYTLQHSNIVGYDTIINTIQEVGNGINSS